MQMFTHYLTSEGYVKITWCSIVHELYLLKIHSLDLVAHSTPDCVTTMILNMSRMGVGKVDPLCKNNKNLYLFTKKEGLENGKKKVCAAGCGGQGSNLGPSVC